MVFLVMAFISFIVVMYFGWMGKVGLVALGCLIASITFFFMGRKKIENKATRQRITQFAKLLFTIAGIMVLLRHPIETGIVDVPTDGSVEIQIQWNQDQLSNTYASSVYLHLQIIQFDWVYVYR